MWPQVNIVQKRILWVAGVMGLITLLFSGCASSQVMYRHPDFQFSELPQAGLAIGGVSGMQLDPRARTLTGEVLRDDLSQMLNNVHVTSLEEVRRLVGLEQHEMIVAEASEKLGPEESDLRMLARVRELPRFLLWVHLTGYDGDKYEETSSITEFDTTYDSETKTFETTSRTVGHSYSAGIFVKARATAVLYDTQRARFVWVAGGRDFARAENTTDNPASLRHPPAPGVVWLVRKIIRNMVVKLQKDSPQTAVVPKSGNQ